MIFENFSEDSFEPVSHNNRICKHVLLRKGQCANIMQLARAIFPPGERVETHMHEDMVEVFMVVEGTGQIVINEKSFELKKNVCVVVESGELHELINTGEMRLIVDYFGLLDGLSK